MGGGVVGAPAIFAIDERWTAYDSSVRSRMRSLELANDDVIIKKVVSGDFVFLRLTKSDGGCKFTSVALGGASLLDFDVLIRII